MTQSSPSRLRDSELKKIIGKISVLCLSEEFEALRKELEEIYASSNVKKPQLCAFEDALYSLLSQQEDVEFCKVKAF